MSQATIKLQSIIKWSLKYDLKREKKKKHRRDENYENIKTKKFTAIIKYISTKQHCDVCVCVQSAL